MPVKAVARFPVNDRKRGKPETRLPARPSIATSHDLRKHFQFREFFTKSFQEFVRIISGENYLDKVEELEDKVDRLQRQCDEMQTKLDKALQRLSHLERRDRQY